MKQKTPLKTANRFLLAVAVLLVLAVGVLGALGWYEAQPKFQDVTVELGTQSIGIDMFLTEYGRANRARFVSDVTTLDIGIVGESPVTLRQGRCVQTVTLRVVDTTAPEADFLDALTVHPDYVPNPADFVTDVRDLNKTEISFAAPVTVPDDLRDTPCTVVVRDASGNEVSHSCVLRFEWMVPELTLELGQTLTAAELLYCPEQTGDLIPTDMLQTINEGGVGEYTVLSQTGGRTAECAVTVQDTTGPALELQTVQTRLGAVKQLEDFVVSAEDLSGDVTLELLTDPDYSVYGRQTVTIRATDIFGNITEKQAELAIAKDFNPPSIGGVGGVLSIPKHGPGAYLEGVYAIDPEDGEVEVTCDHSNVDEDVPGTYFITYTASDIYYNTTTVRRKVVVEHGEDDTQALVTELAATLSDDPELIRDYVRKTIGYSSSWGGDDPVWYGFKNYTGNCYVHATCLHALLQEKGFNTMIIGTTCKTHYWVLIEIADGVWRHIDATPSEPHNQYSLMTDQERLWTLGGRTWDTSAFPACE